MLVLNETIANTQQRPVICLSFVVTPLTAVILQHPIRNYGSKWNMLLEMLRE